MSSVASIATFSSEAFELLNTQARLDMQEFSTDSERRQQFDSLQANTLKAKNLIAKAHKRGDVELLVGQSVIAIGSWDKQTADFLYPATIAAINKADKDDKHASVIVSLWRFNRPLTVHTSLVLPVPQLDQIIYTVKKRKPRSDAEVEKDPLWTPKKKRSRVEGEASTDGEGETSSQKSSASSASKLSKQDFSIAAEISAAYQHQQSLLEKLAADPADWESRRDLTSLQGELVILFDNIRIRHKQPYKVGDTVLFLTTLNDEIRLAQGRVLATSKPGKAKSQLKDLLIATEDNPKGIWVKITRSVHFESTTPVKGKKRDSDKHADTTQFTQLEGK